MKRLLLPGLMALAIHAVLLGLRLPRQAPALPLSANRGITVDLSMPAPPARRPEPLHPLPRVAARPLAPLSPKVLPALRPHPVPPPPAEFPPPHRPAAPAEPEEPLPQRIPLPEKQGDPLPPAAEPAADALPTGGKQEPPAGPEASPDASPAVMAIPLPGHNPPPAYPDLARRRGCEGTVVLDILVGSDGIVQQVRLKRSSGYALLDDSAREAVRAWRYEPARRGHVTVDMWIEQPIVFSLTGP